jgi:hypothetical protein
MNVKYCQFCGTRGDFVACGCGFSAVLDCASKIACKSCETAHKRVFGPFFRALLGTRHATRANSPRTRLLEILHGSVCYHSAEEIGEKDFVLRSLRATSPFDENLGNFRACVLDVAASMRLNAAIAKTLSSKISEASVIRVIEQLGDLLRAESDLKAIGLLSSGARTSRRRSSVRVAPTARDFYR